MEPTPKTPPADSAETGPAQPNPADNSLPAKGSPDSQGADKPVLTNQPRPGVAAAPPAPPAATEETSESQAAGRAAPAADPSAADIQPDTQGDADPGASNIGAVQPL